MATTADYYEILGVDEDAGEEEIKQAWFRKVKEHPPQEEPEEFKKVREAYETLSDPDRREDYDARYSYGEEITRLIEEGERQVQWGNYRDAIPKYKKAWSLNKQNLEAGEMLARLYLETGSLERAEEVQRELVEMEPGQHHLHTGLGDILFAQGLEAGVPVTGWENKRKLRASAEEYEKAIELEPRDVSAYSGVAQCHFMLKELEEAANWLDRAVHADDQLDAQDAELLILLIKIRTAQTDLSATKSAARRLKRALDYDSELCEGAAGILLQDLLDAEDNPVWDYFLLEAASVLADLPYELEEARKGLAERWQAYQEYQSSGGGGGGSYSSSGGSYQSGGAGCVVLALTAGLSSLTASAGVWSQLLH